LDGWMDFAMRFSWTLSFLLDMDRTEIVRDESDGRQARQCSQSVVPKMLCTVKAFHHSDPLPRFDLVPLEQMIMPFF
jgi:hypothetical protein